MTCTLEMFLIYFSIVFRAYMRLGAHTHVCGARGGVKRVLDPPPPPAGVTSSLSCTLGMHLGPLQKEHRLLTAKSSL